MGHWYKEDGTPVHRIKSISTGKFRDTTLRDAKKYSFYPSVTSIISLISSPYLELWKQDQILQAALDWPHDNISCVEQWKRDIKCISNRVSNTAKDNGHTIHRALEDSINNKRISVDKYKQIEYALSVLHESFGKKRWITEKTFCYKKRFGGSVDLHCREDSQIIIDFKTKNTTDITKMTSYNQHIMQLAAYKHGLELPRARCYNLFISTIDSRIVVLNEISQVDLKKGWIMFKCLLKYWQLINNI